MYRTMRTTLILVVLLAMTLAGTVQAQVQPERSPEVAAKAYRHADLDIQAHHNQTGELPAQAARQAQRQLARLGVHASSARVDRRSGRFSTLLPATPLVPGNGVGNTLSWMAEPNEQTVRQAFTGYLEAYQAELKIDLGELAADARVVSHGNGTLYQIYVPRTIDGIAVRGSYITAVVNHGNLVLFGAHQWGDRGDAAAQARPQLNREEVQAAAADYVAPLYASWGKSEQIYVPMARGQKPTEVGGGYHYQLVWALRARLKGDAGSWEALVDAYTGEVLAFEDLNQYAEVKGGVLPVTNDGIDPDGVEQGGSPMPYQDTTLGTTDTGGNVAGSGSITATFYGPYVNINDNCGSDSLTQTNNIDWGTSGGTDCTTPGFGGSGNTHAARTGFYELNKMIEMARGQLPSNSWLQSRLTSNMNINSTCNAYWNGTVNFYRSGGGCSNTGELAGVFDHEWGHGLDQNDATPGIANPSGEGIADIYTALRLNTSCIGRNFRPGVVCTGYGDPCLSCTGVRDIDYLMRQSGQPHDYSWSNSNCSSVHCRGYVYSEAVWSLWKRKLQSAPYNMDNNTAHEIVTRLTFIGAGATGTWFSGSPPNGGCAGSSGYLNYLAADDDNGNINDGTPHMAAIYAAFNDQEIACGTPTVQDSGCSGIPTTAPIVSASSGNQSASLSWGSVSGATDYQVFRTEGVFACDFGKVKLGETSSTSWNDNGLQNGRIYSYVVIPIGGADACMGPASLCTNVTPSSAPDFSVSCAPSSHSVQQGDNAASTCTVTAIAGYSGTVNLSCSGNPAGVGCAFSPGSVSPTASSALTISVDLAQATGTYNFNVVGDDGSTTRTSGMSVTVTPEGQNGPQDAVYDAGLGAPTCAVAGSECDSLALLDGRDSVGPEPNQPNTLDSCTDGTSGSYHSDESNDAIVVSTLDGLDFADGATVQVDVTVYAWSTGTSDHLDLYYAADANSPAWTLITTIDLTSGGLQTLSAQYTLPSGDLQAVRANFRYNGSQSTCSGGSYDDADDLVFAVGTGSVCTGDPQCDDGVYCNGAETCNLGTGQCESGTPVVCDDSVACTDDSCNEGTDSCDYSPNDGYCDNGLYCDGTETCNATLGCQAGTAVNCGDGVGCTVDSCNEGTDQCDNTPDDAVCDNGLFCDGTEVCDVALDCQDGADPCTGSQTCDEVNDVCEGGGDCTHDVDFESGAGGWTNGADTCTTGFFVVGSPDATDWQVSGGNPGDAYYTQPNSGGIGTDDVDGGTCEALSPAVDCSGEAAAAVSLDYYHGQRDAGDDSGDGFSIEVLSDGVVVDTMVLVGDVTHNAAWTNVSTVVASPGSLQLRVRATDAASGGDIVEGGIDNVQISPSTVPDCVVDDDFEGGASGWVNDPASTCTTGDYVTGDPTNATSGYQIVGSHSGVTSLFTAVNTSAGVNDVDGGNCILGSPSWSVPNASTLSVWYWHGQRDAGDDASGDFFYLEYSTNGGSNWTTLASNGDTTSNPAWLNATAAIPAGSNVQLRVQCSDGPSTGDLVECGIDDFSICE